MSNIPLIKRILCPIDFSHASGRAFAYANELAKQTSAELVLLHAFDVPETLNLMGQEHPSDPTLREQLDRIPVADEVRVVRLLHAGPAGAVICWTAQERGCDLIVMGTHGRSALTHLLMGSVAEYVLRHARSPVLTLRDRPADEPPLKEPHVLPVPAPRFL
ncbi:MAG TPA: universal stress protein [Pirellulales bacterium]|nr:universal stress protein [Pirellulales bacterium]